MGGSGYGNYVKGNGQGNGHGNGNTYIKIHDFNNPNKVIYEGYFGDENGGGAGNGNGNGS